MSESGFEFEIEKGVEIPHSRKGGGKYPFPKMEHGDSFYVDLDDTDFETLHSLQRSIIVCGLRHGKKRGMKCVTRQIGNGVRVWLINDDTEGSSDE